MTDVLNANPSVAETLDKLVEDSTEHDYNPFDRFAWAESMAYEQWWMSPALMSVHGTPWAEQLDEAQLMRLSKWESINFFSLNVHGIRELLIEVTRRIHTPGFEVASEFFHRFLREENSHMWFFAQFCHRYGGKLYPDKALRQADESRDQELASFLVFARILIFEELVDHFNIRMGKDSTLHPLIREINQAHHDDEWRHIVMGRKVVEQLYEPLRARGDQAVLDHVDDYLCRYMVSSIQSLYNPSVYRDAGLSDGYALRTDLLQLPGRAPHHEAFMHRIAGYLVNHGIIERAPYQP